MCDDYAGSGASAIAAHMNMADLSSTLLSLPKDIAHNITVTRATRITHLMSTNHCGSYVSYGVDDLLHMPT